MLGADTKERILNAAERLFGEEGFAGTSLRAVTAAAGVNLAAVNYYFHSKEALFQEIIQRRLGTLATERLRRLTMLKTSGSEITVEALLEAYLAPLSELFGSEGGQGSALMLLIGRVISDPNPRIQQIVIELAQEMAQDYLAAFALALPHLSPQELWWRFRSMNVVATFFNAPMFDGSLLAGQWLPDAPPSSGIDPAWIKTFLLAALRAPATMPHSAIHGDASATSDDGQ
jgi:AcrR family transcriptional regulator